MTTQSPELDNSLDQCGGISSLAMMNHTSRYWASNHSFFVGPDAHHKRSSMPFTRVGIVGNLTLSRVFFDSITTGLLRSTSWERKEGKGTSLGTQFEIYTGSRVLTQTGSTEAHRKTIMWCVVKNS